MGGVKGRSEEKRRCTLEKNKNKRKDDSERLRLRRLTFSVWLVSPLEVDIKAVTRLVVVLLVVFASVTSVYHQKGDKLKRT